MPDVGSKSLLICLTNVDFPLPDNPITQKISPCFTLKETSETPITELYLSNASVFIFMSSVKAVADQVDGVLTEDNIPNPITPYGISKLQAENYILNQQLPEGKRFYILRPSMIHGPGNKGNLNLLYSFVNKGYPWPLAAFENKRSFLSIDNLCFVTKEIVENDSIPSGVYNIADDQAISTNQLISLISKSQNKNTKSVFLPKKLIYAIAKVGSILHLPINTERLIKLTDNYVISNKKILKSCFAQCATKLGNKSNPVMRSTMGVFKKPAAHFIGVPSHKTYSEAL